MKKFKGVALVSVLLLVSVLGLILTNTSTIFIDDLSHENQLEFNLLGQVIFKDLSAQFLAENIPLLRSSSKNINQQLINSLNLNEYRHESLTATFTIHDLSNCFNINAIFDENLSSLNPINISYFRNLLLFKGLDGNHINALIDQMIDWVDLDDYPREYGLENYYYVSPARSYPRYTSKRLFVSKYELLNLPAAHDTFSKFEDVVCAIPNSNDFSLNVNTLDVEQIDLLLALIEDPNRELIEEIIINSPLDGYASKQAFIELINASLMANGIDIISTESKFFTIEGLLSDGTQQSTYAVDIRLDAINLELLDYRRLL